jgi:hypothetical protein
MATSLGVANVSFLATRISPGRRLVANVCSVETRSQTRTVRRPLSSFHFDSGPQKNPLRHKDNASGNTFSANASQVIILERGAERRRSQDSHA